MVNIFKVDKELILEKGKVFSITQNFRLWASLNLTRYQRTCKLLNDLDCILLKNKLNIFSDLVTQQLNFDCTLDENIVYLVMALKNTDDQELNDLSTSFGKLQLKDQHRGKFKEKRLKNWFFTKHVHTIHRDEELFNQEFRKGIRDILQDMSGDDKPFITLKEFINDFGLWGTAGSIYGKNIPSEIKKYIKKNKWGLAVTTNLDNLYDEIMNKINSNAPLYYTTMEKNEPTTVRYVVVADIYSYLCEAYLSYFFEHKLSTCKQLFNYHSDASKVMFWEKRREYLIIMNKIAYDLDYSGWDENMTLMMIQIILEELRYYIPQEQECQRILSWLITCIYNTFVDGQLTENGLASGRRWTTFLNSIANACIQRIACKYTGIQLIDDVALGDDEDCLVDSVFDAELHMEFLNSMGFTINKLKSKIGKTGEFLKTNYNKKGIYQSPFRLLRSVLYSSEEERDFTSSFEVIQARLDNWMKLCGRLTGYNKNKSLVYDMFKISNTIIYDFVHLLGHKIPGLDIKRWLVSPSTMSGGGITYIDPNFSTSFLRNSKKWVALDIKKEGFVVYDRNVLKYITRKTNKIIKDNKYNDKIIKNLYDITTKTRYGKGDIELTRYDKPAVNNDLVRLLLSQGNYLVKNLSAYKQSNLHTFRPELPKADSGYYTTALLNLNNVTIDDILADVDDVNNLVTCKNGEVIGPRTLLVFSSLIDFKNKTIGKSRSIINLMLNNKMLNLPRELLCLGGEVSGSIYWIVLQTFTNVTLNNINSLETLNRFYASLNILLRCSTSYLYDKNVLNILACTKGTVCEYHMCV